MHVIDLTDSAESFETSTRGQPEGYRTFGLFSYRTPAEGDLIVIQRGARRALYQVVGTPTSSFTGSDGNRWWTGRMMDVIHHDKATRQMLTALKAAGLA